MKKKAILSIVVDIILIGLIVAAVSVLLLSDNNDIVRNLLYMAIIVIIPTVFFITYNAFAGDKYDFDKIDPEEDELSEEAAENDIKDSIRYDNESEDKENIVDGEENKEK